jgi:hypothetical protein
MGYDGAGVPWARDPEDPFIRAYPGVAKRSRALIFPVSGSLTPGVEGVREGLLWG